MAAIATFDKLSVQNKPDRDIQSLHTILRESSATLLDHEETAVFLKSPCTIAHTCSEAARLDLLRKSVTNN